MVFKKPNIIFNVRLLTAFPKLNWGRDKNTHNHHTHSTSCQRFYPVKLSRKMFRFQKQNKNMNIYRYNHVDRNFFKSIRYMFYYVYLVKSLNTHSMYKNQLHFSVQAINQLKYFQMILLP